MERPVRRVFFSLLLFPLTLLLSNRQGHEAQSVKLTPDLARDSTVFSLQIMPDRRHAVLNWDARVRYRYELCSVALFPPYEFRRLFDGQGGGILPTPDSSRVIYHSQDPAGYFQIYSSSVDGSTPTQLLSLGGTTPASNPRLTLDGSRVVFEQGDRLHVVPVDGSAPPLALWSGSSVSGVWEFQLCPDGRSVVLMTNSPDQLYRVRLDGSEEPFRLGGTWPSFGRLDENARLSRFSLSPDGTRVVFKGDLAVDQRDDLYSAPIEGGSTRSLIVTQPPFVDWPLDYRITPDSTRVVWRADARGDDYFELFSAPIDGGTVIILNPALQPNQDVLYTFDFSPDGRYVLYVAEQEVSGRNELYRVPVDGSGPAVRISGAMSGSGVVPAYHRYWYNLTARTRSFEVDPVHGRVVFFANLAPGEGYRLMSAPIESNEPMIQLAPQRFDFDANTLYPRARLTVGGGSVLFHLGEATDFDLMRVGTRGGAPPLRVHRRRTPGEEIGLYAQPQGPTLYSANLATLGSFDLFLFLPDPAPPFVQPR